MSWQFVAKWVVLYALIFIQADLRTELKHEKNQTANQMCCYLAGPQFHVDIKC